MPHSKPNILILFTDMQRADTIHALGNETIRTPHLDRLVAEGTAFTNCYSPSPVCVPARCSFHYGMYPQKTQSFGNSGMMPDNGKSFQAVLGRSGYRTHAVGKCHFTPDDMALRGFDSRRTQEECRSDPKTDDYLAWLRANRYDDYEPHGARGEMYYIPQVSTLPAKAHPSQWIGDESIDFLKNASRKKSQAWCLFSSFIHPHPPFAPPKPWHRLYRAPDMPLPFIPGSSAELMTWVNRLQNRYKYRDRGLDLNLLRVIKAYYYATISFVDYQIGRILEILEKTGQLDNALIVFTSDHGEHLGDFNCFGKRSMHDASSRVPMIVRFPARFRAGVRCTTAASLVDVFPTLVNAGGAVAGDVDLDGIDLAEIARGGMSERNVYSQYGRVDKAIYMVVNERWKYVYSAGDLKEFLFDRRRDPRETRNIAASPKASAARDAMKHDLLNYLRSVGAKEAFTTTRKGLDWRKYPRMDETYLRDPDAKLLFQDYPTYPTELPGYTEK